jgi:protoheme IX farnesyltransferase
MGFVMTDMSVQNSEYEASMGDYFALLKPRVMSLVIFTALVGLLVAPVSVHPFIGFVGVLCIAVGAGASGALNMWWDADIDAIMKRTAKRPIPSGRVQPGEALGIGLALSGFAIILLLLATNVLAAGLPG